MKYFNRQDQMGTDILKEIGRIKEQLFFIEGVNAFGTLSNYLAGLYDGYNYEEKVFQTDCIKVIKETKPDLYTDIVDLFDVVNEYSEIESPIIPW